MKRIIAALAPVALCACAYSAERAVAPPAVTASQPTQIIPVEDQQVLFWDDATRADRFRRMEDFFAGLEVAPAPAPRRLPQGQPLDAALSAALDSYVADKNVAGIMVLENGRVRYERYGLDFGPTQRWTSFSVAKSFTSTLLGAALRDGLVESLDDPVSRYVKGLEGSAYDDVTVRQLATMTSGVKWNEDYTDPDSDVARMFGVAPVEGESQAVTYMKTLAREAPAGSKWVYKTGETNLLGLVVEGATGMSLAAYAKTRLVDPAGFSGPLFWMTDLTGGNVGGCCLSIRLSDYARFGQFVLEGGKGVVPEGWFDEAGAQQVGIGIPGFGYGYQWWTYPGTAFGAQGIFGQSVTILPDRNMVVAIVSNWPTAVDRSRSIERLALISRIAASAEAD